MKAILGLVVAFSAGVIGACEGADFPDHPVRVIVPYAAGGPTDVTARLDRAKGSPSGLDSRSVIDNRGGAGGNIGTRGRRYRGGRRLHADLHHARAGHQHDPLRKIPVTTSARDFSPIGSTHDCARTPGRAIPRLGPARSGSVIAIAKANPGNCRFASQGVGVAPHLIMEMIKKRAGINLVHVPYRGSAPALNERDRRQRTADDGTRSLPACRMCAPARCAGWR